MRSKTLYIAELSYYNDERFIKTYELSSLSEVRKRILADYAPIAKRKYKQHPKYIPSIQVFCLNMGTGFGRRSGFIYLDMPDFRTGAWLGDKSNTGYQEIDPKTGSVSKRGY